MKLYATTTSERATKGQGGNDFLNIEIFNADNDIIAVININHPLWFKNPQMSINYNSTMIDISRHNMEMESQKLKGKQ
jgi:hypothetical protein